MGSYYHNSPPGNSSRYALHKSITYLVTDPKHYFLVNFLIMKKTVVKKIYTNLFMLLTVSFLLLPVVTTFDHLLTRSLNGIGNNNLVQKYVVPHEAKIIAVVLKPLGFVVEPTPTGIYVNRVLVTIWWSCIGWQSLIVTLLSFWPGLNNGDFTVASKIETVILGVLGFFFLTVFRLVSVAVVGAYFGTNVALMYHDLFAASLLTFGWLFGFWWFCYGWVLEEKVANGSELQTNGRE